MNEVTSRYRYSVTIPVRMGSLDPNTENCWYYDTGDNYIEPAISSIENVGNLRVHQRAGEFLLQLDYASQNVVIAE